MDLSGKLILFIIAQKNFRDEELLETRRILESFKAKTLLASSTMELCYGMLGARVKPNLTLDSIQVNNYDAVVFVGGQGSTIFWDDKTAIDIAKEANLKGKILCSICMASGILACAGVFKGKNATGWEDTKEIIEKNGGKYTGNDIEVSGRIISAIGPMAARKFGEAIAKALESRIEE